VYAAMAAEVEMGASAAPTAGAAEEAALPITRAIGGWPVAASHTRGLVGAHGDHARAVGAEPGTLHRCRGTQAHPPSGRRWKCRFYLCALELAADVRRRSDAIPHLRMATCCSVV
jgi:hypothetical protein